MSFYQLLCQLPRVSVEPLATARFKQRPEDFFVKEVLNFELAGEGDHLCLQLEKKLLNTQDVIDRLRSVLAVKAADIGYFGLKDKNAVAQQWFSIHLPAKAVSPAQLPFGEGLRLLAHTRHRRKFRIGSHRANHFRIVLREFAGDPEQFSSGFARIAEQGFPNYFGEQRFGFQARNVERALALFQAQPITGAGRAAKTSASARRKHSLYLSAARGFLFNMILAERVRQGSWLTPLDDEKLILAGTQSYFQFDPREAKAELLERLAAQDIHTTAALWGRTHRAEEEISEFERHCIEPFAELAAGLERAGLKTARRALRACVSEEKISWQDGQTVMLEFTLPTGCYATSLLRELCLTLS